MVALTVLVESAAFTCCRHKTDKKNNITDRLELNRILVLMVEWKKWRAGL